MKLTLFKLNSIVVCLLFVNTTWATNFTDIKFSKFQVADSQWNTSSCYYNPNAYNGCQIYSKNPGIAYKIPWYTGRINWVGAGNGAYVKFESSGSNYYPYTAKVYRSDGTFYQLMGTGKVIYTGTVDGKALFFFMGNDNNTGQVFSISEGLDNNNGFTMVGIANPTTAEMDTYADTYGQEEALGSGELSSPGGSTPSYSSSPTNNQLQNRIDARGITHDGNGIYIEQSGIGVNIDIIQSGDDNFVSGSSSTTQSFSKSNLSGNYNALDIKQKSVNNGLLFDIYGNHNTLSVSQGNYNGDIGGHRAIVNITGNYNSPSLLQYNIGFGSGQFADLNISGNNNTINSAQRETDKMLFVDVNGDDNIVSTDQKDSGQHFLDITLSSDQTVSVTQEGIGDHSATIDLSGYSSTLQLNQNSSTDQTYSINQTCLTVTGCGTTTVTQQ